MFKKFLSICTPFSQRKPTNKSGAGFTLIELLVVIAIIGILSAIAIVNLNSARNRAKNASAKHGLSEVVTAGFLCQDSGWNINCELGQATTTSCGILGGTPEEGKKICASNDPANTIGTWPKLSDYGWIYQGGASAYSSTTAHTFSFIAQQVGSPFETYTCTEGGCQSSL